MPGGHLGRLVFFLLASAAAQQQHQAAQDDNAHRGSPPEHPVLQPRTLKHAPNAPRADVNVPRHGDADAKPNTLHLSGTNQRAIATLAPADPHPAVRAPHSARPAADAGIQDYRSSQDVVARSLRDWEVEDLILLATIDGRIHAVDRKTGKKERWVYPPPHEPSRPLVNTEYHRRSYSNADATISADEWLWIVEPTKDGALYIYRDNGLHKVPATVKALFDMSFYQSTEEPFVTYSSKRDMTAFTLNAATGVLIKEESPDSVMFGLDTDESCKPITGFETPDEKECESKSHFIIARNDYTIVIRNQTGGQPICTIRYSEWSPNSRDRDLAQEYEKTPEDAYILSGHDGRFQSVDLNKIASDGLKPIYQNKLSAPVVRVFDVARRIKDDPKKASLVILPQPSYQFDGIIEDMNKIFVNCTESGGWYAMSEQRYPYVTTFAKPAQCYANLDAFYGDVQYWPSDIKYSPRKWELVGKHSLAFSDAGRPQDPLQISGPLLPDIRAPGDVQLNPGKNFTPLLIGDLSTKASWGQRLKMAYLLPILMAVLTTVAAAAYLLMGDQLLKRLPTTAAELVPSVSPLMEEAVEVKATEPPPSEPTIAEPERKVKFDLPDESTADSVESTPSPVTEASNPMLDSDAAAEAGGTTADDAADVPKKKKVHRGQRGGKKRKKKPEMNNNEDRLTEQIGRQIEQDRSLQPDEISASGGSNDVSNSAVLNNLEIFKDRVIGLGSGGTVVYVGRKGNRDVAVKQMMPQYFELALQEVNLLEQSDDHPNVIRYFDYQRDSNFIYIAVELCQASLFDLYKDGGTRDGLKDSQLALVNQINCNISVALLQLAEGLSHLHKMRIIHRDIKPQNILVAYPKKHETAGPRLVISDFGLCKLLPDHASTLAGTTNNAGTLGWKAPELIGKVQGGDGDNSQLSQKDENSSVSSNDVVTQGVKRAVDIFSLGCVFFYVLTNGAHPFDSPSNEAWTVMREINIKQNKPNFQPLDALGPESEEPKHLLDWMLQHDPLNRPTALQVKHHPFFWSPAKRLNFLCDVSDHFEREPRDPPSEHLEVLEAYAAEVIGPGADFLAKLDRKFVDTLGKQRKYQGGRMLDLLRAFRNKKNHYEDMPEEVQARVGNLSDGGYLNYWTSRFPVLLVRCYDVLEECGLQRRPRFVPYLGSGEN